MHCEYLCRVFPQAVYHPVVAEETFAELIDSDFGNHSSSEREVLDGVGKLYDSQNGVFGSLGRVTCDVVANRLDIFKGLRRPEDTCHLRSRSLASW